MPNLKTDFIFGSGKDLRNLSDEKNTEIDKDSVIHKFKGKGQQDIILITYTGMIKLVMALPGKNAKLIRGEFAGKLMRYYAGDTSLVAEIEQNKESTNPINVAAREEMAATGGSQDALMIRCEELESRLKRVEDINQAFLAKTIKSDHRKQLYEKTVTHKRKLEEKDYDVAIHLSKNKSDVEKQQAIAKEVIAMEEAATRTLLLKLELIKLEQAAQVPAASAPEPPAASVLIVKGITIGEVARKHKLTTDTVILSAAGRLLKKLPYNLIPFDVQGIDIGYDNREIPVNQFHPLDEDKIITGIKQAEREHIKKQPKQSNATNSIASFFGTSQDIPSVAVVEGAGSSGITIHINKSI